MISDAMHAVGHCHPNIEVPGAQCAWPPNITLRHGVKLPRCGLGTFKAAGSEVVAAVVAALHSGIRHIDTAQIYKNEVGLQGLWCSVQ